MKALDYLYRMKEANEQVGQEPINIYEAIKELEDLQNRSCRNCKWEELDKSRYLTKHRCMTGCNKVGYDFYCSEWELK